MAQSALGDVVEGRMGTSPMGTFSLGDHRPGKIFEPKFLWIASETFAQSTCDATMERVCET